MWGTHRRFSRWVHDALGLWAAYAELMADKTPVRLSERAIELRASPPSGPSLASTCSSLLEL